MGIFASVHTGLCCGYKTLSKDRDYDSDLYTAISKRDTDRGETLGRNLSASGLGYTYVIPKSIQDEETLGNLIRLKEKYPKSKAVVVSDCIFFTTCESTYLKPLKGDNRLCFFVRDIGGEPSKVGLFYTAVSLLTKIEFEAQHGTISPSTLLKYAYNRGYAVAKSCVDLLLDPDYKSYATQTLEQYQAHGSFLESLGFKVALASKNPNTSTVILLLVRGDFKELNLE